GTHRARRGLDAVARTNRAGGGRDRGGSIFRTGSRRGSPTGGKRRTTRSTAARPKRLTGSTFGTRPAFGDQSGRLSRGTGASFDWESADTPALVVGLNSGASLALGAGLAAGPAVTGAASCWAGAASSRPG